MAQKIKTKKMSKTIFILLLYSLCNLTLAQTMHDDSVDGIDFYIHEEVTNADGAIEQELITL